MLELKVSEAPSEDVGRGIVRIDPEHIAKLEVEAGDIVKIIGDGTAFAAAKVLPTRPQDRGKWIIQMDGVLRGNAKARIDGFVKLEKADCAPAQLVRLSPLTLSPMAQSRDGNYIKKLLLNIPLKPGDRVRANLFGAGFQTFEVLSSKPSGIVMITPDTVVEIQERPLTKEEGKERRGVSYEDVGGLKHQLDRIREMIELPLKYPQLFEQLGIDPPKGVLLYGAPGTGKTLIARALASETDAYFTSIAGPEILSMFYGQSEANLRRVFNEAKRNQPALIFIDEIDALCPKRAEVIGEVEKRVVSQLLALMDGLEPREQVVVIAATNIPEVLDPALRRPGRFDREIVIPIPDEKGRLQILEIHTRGMPLSQDVDLKKLAEITHGFVGADLAALCREAAMRALRRILPDLDLESGSISYETIFDLKVERRDFEEALKEVEPSATREVFVEIPNVTWQDVGGLHEIKEKLKQAIEWPLKHRDAFEKLNVRLPKGILIWGPPGTGKTLLAKAVANECGVNFISVKGPEILSKWLGESEKKIRELFRKARQAAPCIIFIDELDALATERGRSMGSDVYDRVTSQLLTELDGIESLQGVIVIGATNKKDLVDEALLRPGRLELQLETKTPDLVERVEIFRVHTRKMPLANDIDFENLALDTEGLNGADIEFICREAAMNKIRAYVESQGQMKLEELKLTQNDFLNIIEPLKTKKEAKAHEPES